jgi:hypothetical protein
MRPEYDFSKGVRGKYVGKIRKVRFYSWLICWLRTAWYSGFSTPEVSGCDYDMNEEEDVPALVTTARCKCCGEYSVTWKRVNKEA